MYSIFIGLVIAFQVCAYFAEFVVFRSMFSETILLLFIAYAFMMIADIYFMIASAYHLFQLAKTLEISQQNRFNYEKKWYWMYMAFLTSMIFTWMIEILCWNDQISSSLPLSIIVDVTKLFTAVNIFIIFVMRKSVQEMLFNKYRALRGNFSNSEADIRKF